jgi:hypothetical protein
VPLLGGLALVAAFVAVEARTDAPLVPLRSSVAHPHDGNVALTLVAAAFGAMFFS